ncbi:MAG: S28 family serine protease [bacterium]
MKNILAALLSLIWFAAYAQEDQLLVRLKALPDVAEVQPARVDPLFKSGYELRIRQPLDHANPSGKTFLQSVYLSHADFDKPVLFETEGYSARSGSMPKELTSILKCNQIIVEHRYFGKSSPDTLHWQYLTTKQAADDHHHIVQLLKSLYRGKWISSGTSKGGQTTLFFRYYYPKDVDVSVAYVAPVNVSQEDPRLIKFLRAVGTEEVREKIKKYQIAMLKREPEMLPMIDTLAKKRNLTFSIGRTLAYEYGILEYACSFWQSGHSADQIPPPDAPADSMMNYFDKIGTLFYYTDRGIKTFEPFQYQAYTEIGYYGYDISDFKQYLTAMKNPTNSILAPRNVELKFNPVTMYNVYSWLRDYGSNIIYIYGETDLWGATAVELSGMTNALKIVKKGGAHSTRIRTLPREQQEQVFGALEEWLGINLEW